MAVEPTLRAHLRSPLPLTLLVLATLVAVACGGAAGGAAVSPGASSGASAPPASSGEVTSEQAAAQRVGLENRLLAGVRPKEADAIGQAHSWSATRTADGWRLEYTIGWGDCLAGCIERHSYTYEVARDGTVTLVDEAGDAIPADVREALEADADTPVVAQGVSGRVSASPTCPVEQPGDPSCAPRPVVGATIVIRGADGAEAARLMTDANGTFAVELPVGEYALEPQPVEGLMGTPSAIPFRVEAGRAAELDITYDTGIR